MTKGLRVLVSITLFIVIFFVTIRPSWWLMEELMTRDFSSEQRVPTHFFAVLVRRLDRADRYAVDFYPELEPQTKLVTDFPEQELAVINQDLNTSISVESSKYVYFKVLRRGRGYVDVSLETPTTGDYWRKDSYRIQDGKIHPLRIIFFGPTFGMMVALPAGAAGALAVVACKALIRRRQKNLTQTVVKY